MEWLEKIWTDAARMVAEFSESAGVCLFISGSFAVMSMIVIRGVVSGLFEMHRSRSAQKKIYKKYTFGQKMILKHAWQDCLHAKRFCRFMIVCHHSIAGLFFVELLLVIFSNIWPVLMQFVAIFPLVFFIGVLIPVLILGSSLDKYPFRRFKHEYTFRKYHNTQDHDNLW